MENARSTVSSVIGNKPIDASDIKVIKSFPVHIICVLKSSQLFKET